jgi:hypothetical protein
MGCLLVAVVVGIVVEHIVDDNRLAGAEVQWPMEYTSAVSQSEQEGEHIPVAGLHSMQAEGVLEPCNVVVGPFRYSLKKPACM